MSHSYISLVLSCSYTYNYECIVGLRVYTVIGIYSIIARTGRIWFCEPANHQGHPDYYNESRPRH